MTSYSYYILAGEQRDEMFAAYIERYKAGEIGPVTFRTLCQRIGISKDEIDAAKVAHLDACAAAMDRRIRNE